MDGHCHILPVADVLVGRQLSAFSTRYKHPYLQHAINKGGPETAHSILLFKQRLPGKESFQAVLAEPGDTLLCLLKRLLAVRMRL